MIVSALLCVLAVFAWMQPSTARRRYALLFIVPALAHLVFSQYLGGQAYYFSAAMTDLLVIILISFLSASELLAVSLILLSTMSMCLNLIGAVIYAEGFPPTVYNAAFVLLYIAALIAMAIQDGSNVGIGGDGGIRHGGDGDADSGGVSVNGRLEKV